MKVIITSESTCDLSKELIDKYNIKILPLLVSLGDDNFCDGVNINPQNIFDYFKKTGGLPKTAARSIEDYKDLFSQYTDLGYEVVHIAISSELSASYNNSRLAALEVPNVYTVDSASLSTGVGVLAIYAAELAQSGKYTGEQIKNMVEKRVPYIQASFIIGNMKFLHKGGRCSAVAAFGANLLKIKPSIIVENGKLRVGKKYMGPSNTVIKKYVTDILNTYNNPDNTRIFITYSSATSEMIEAAKKVIEESGKFKEIHITQAGATITGHCGENTLGVLYINDGGATI